MRALCSSLRCWSAAALLWRETFQRVSFVCDREEPQPTLDDSCSPLAHVARLQRTPPRVRLMRARIPQRLLSVCMKPHVVALKDVVSHYTVPVGVGSLDKQSCVC